MHPFPIDVADDELADLYQRVRHTRWPDSVEGAGWDHGTDIDYLRELARYWVDGFDWHAEESLLNKRLPSFVTDVDGRRLHVAHCEANGPTPMPLLLLHGWPGSFAEMYKIAPMLADPSAYGGDAADAFDVYVPSLPGHGFTPPVLDRPFGADECADLLATFVRERFEGQRVGLQGGDRGAFVAASFGARHGELTTGIHLNLATGIPGAADEQTDDEREWLTDQVAWMAQEGGYIAIQGTRPQTLSFGLNDSPVGLLAWIVEKWRAWSDCDGDIESCFTKDELLTNATIYWLTGTIRSSMHWYLEHRRNPPVAVGPTVVDVPTGVAMFPKEVMRVPRSAVERKYDVHRWTEMSRGGHFAAMEQPEALVDEVRAFFRPLRQRA